MAWDAPFEPELDPSRPGSPAALYWRLANTLERSAVLAEQHAARLSGKHQDQLASTELDHAEQARAAARRCRDLAARAH